MADNKKKALDEVNLIEVKRDGQIKGRTCANGSKQLQYLKYGDGIASLTVSIEGLITTMVITAYEREESYIV
eukprot:15348324-Ditylum_brightwellii.AAC.1